MAIGVLYREELREYDFGPGHPFRGDRYAAFLKFLSISARMLPPPRPRKRSRWSRATSKITGDVFKH